MMIGLTRPETCSVLYGGVPYRRLERPVATIGAALDASAHPGRTRRAGDPVSSAGSGLTIRNALLRRDLVIADPSP